MCYTRLLLLLLGLFTLKLAVANFEYGDRDLASQNQRINKVSIFEKNS